MTLPSSIEDRSSTPPLANKPRVYTNVDIAALVNRCGDRSVGFHCASDIVSSLTTSRVRSQSTVTTTTSSSRSSLRPKTTSSPWRSERANVDGLLWSWNQWNQMGRQPERRAFTTSCSRLSGVGQLAEHLVESSFDVSPLPLSTPRTRSSSESGIRLVDRAVRGTVDPWLLSWQERRATEPIVDGTDNRVTSSSTPGPTSERFVGCAST